MSFSKFGRSNVTQACGNGKDISNLTLGILKTLASVMQPVGLAPHDSTYINVRHPPTPHGREQASHPSRQPRVESYLFH